MTKERNRSDIEAGLRAIVDDIEALVRSGHFDPDENGKSWGRENLEALVAVALNFLDPGKVDDAWKTLTSLMDVAMEQKQE